MAIWTKDDLDTIEIAIAGGVLKIEYNDREVTYRSMNDLIKARELIRRSLGLTKRGSRILVENKKGTV